ncbi:MAG: TolC family protein [Candidatus Solibacter sp.]
MRSNLAVLCAVMVAVPSYGFAADPPPQQPDPPQQAVSHPKIFDPITAPYRAPHAAPNNLSNTTRIDSLLRAGNLYLSLQDCIALALENNLDIAIQRYGPQLADAALRSALAGGNARGVSTSVTAGPASASVNAAGTTPGANVSATGLASNASSSAIGQSVISAGGPAIPSLDPVITGNLNWGHITSPQSSAFLTGTNALISTQKIGNVAVTKGWLTGANLSLGLNNTSTLSNNPRNDFNPATNSSLYLSFSQHLLQGFGTGLNSRQIRIARNNREVSDLTFKLQVETTVAAVMELYWDLVSFTQTVQVARDALAASQQLLENNRKQVEVGTLAQIEVVRADAEIATREQALVVAQTRLLQQETILKSALSRTGVANPAIASAHIVPTDRIQVPTVEPVTPIQDMVSLAISARPELAQSRIQLANQQLTMKGSRNGLLPTLDVVANLSNGALAGDPNPLPAPPGSAHSNTAFFIGGYSTVLAQLFARNFPNYSVGLSLNVPIRNRAAQAQVASDEITYRQQQLVLQRLENQVRVDVQNAMIGVSQARAQYQSAQKAQVLQAQTLDAETKKLSLGASTIYNQILAERDLVTAQSSQVTAEAAYARAKVELDRATGQILYNHNVSLDEAVKGSVSRPPSAIPETPQRP